MGGCGCIGTGSKVICILSVHCSRRGHKNVENFTFLPLRVVSVHGQIKGYIEPILVQFWERSREIMRSCLCRFQRRIFLFEKLFPLILSEILGKTDFGETISHLGGWRCAGSV